MSPADSPQTVSRESGEGVYAALIFVAFIALSLTVGVVYFQNTQLSGDPNPFTIVESV